MNRKRGLRNALVLIGLMLIVLITSLSFGGSGPFTDPLIHYAWKKSKHSHTQIDTGPELASSDVGETPQQVIQRENCIACKGPTAVLVNGGMTEAQAFGYFFTTKNGKFTAKTRATRITQWPGVSCNACHDPNNPTQPAYFNSATKQYETVQDSTELCAKCHGNLRFPDTDHLSYNILQGTGGVNVPDQQTMPGIPCTRCHMYTNGKSGSNSSRFAGHTFSVMVREANGSFSASCTNCHFASMDAKAASQIIDQWKEEFQNADVQAQDLVGKATDALNGSTDPVLLNKLDEAQKNLTYAESDESRGFHNHRYLMALVNDAITRSQEILSKLGIPF